ncbi:tRNA (5-methylaminomethyl-2-thiouridine)(34)-methyltransferase MnmD [Dysgonomonas sp. Marseille-P4677]|uniref:tRNA (5-methylaminomethyl-2-thiouridine)(34)-methyltransferase MnmD n=1 Tax=Dysgonomonas sp. Marseille-P4677 TaxID=2364790 RepID=UPI0019129F0B|nr:tRNA (5-methylaminomethyl-2-thiouridine)(34)-methyltransferase MnmD [Dysgonomonas sp. Marseille-P4677]MBK5722608.1 tRNA (5-methylaminomethyl-2-thiouridine)(34)-methyltransferase MnmD [Dysgonomonas sp. Marseille-P4677]
MSVKPVIELTADGSHTLFVPELGEHYHSINGAIQESIHVFINSGLKCCTKDIVQIFEIGFGTGLNAFLTLLNANNCGKKILYTTVEAYPLPDSLIQELNYSQNHSKADQDLYHKLHTVDWGREVEITENFTLTKIKDDFTHFDFSQIKHNVDIVYFDAFAPDKQSDMWTQQIFNQLYDVTNYQGVLVTYCAKGMVRRMMQQAGYTTERLPGPPGKREMLRATKGI